MRATPFLRRLVGCISLGLVFAGSPARAVIVSEIHYHPAEGSRLEFVELYNPALTAVSLADWSFTAGIQFTFPAGASIAARGYVVLARDPAELLREFKLYAESAAVYGPYSSSLDNGGESIVLVDASGTLADQVEYGDTQPWDPVADGNGGSLERLCLEAGSYLPGNWRADGVRGPSPLRPSAQSVCPPPQSATPSVVINEIHYHPTNDADATQEFVELLNTTAAPIDLDGYAFSQGVRFTFAAGSIIPAGGTLVVCRKLDAARSVFGFEGPAVGDYIGQLDNGGERLTLVDPRGDIVDSVKYGDQVDWPVAADSLGRSLERISAGAPGDDPASWQASAEPGSDKWQTATKTGVSTSSTFYVYLAGAGEFVVDDILLENLEQPGVNVLKNGTFDTGLDGWTASGNHADSAWDATAGTDGGGALRIVANGRGSGPSNALVTVIEPALTNNKNFRLSLRYRYLEGDRGLLSRLNNASLSRGIYLDVRNRPLLTPGAPNSVVRAVPPPFISHVARWPSEPVSTDPVTVTARVRGTGIRGVYLDYWLNFKPELVDALELLDDGLHGDGPAGDGVYGVQIPPVPHNTTVAFKIHSEDASGGTRELPGPGDPSVWLGYYVNDDQPESVLPVFHLLLDHLSPMNPLNLLRSLSCDAYRTGAFAYRGELFPNVSIRQRGQSVCNSQKPFLKVRFNRGRDFQKQHKIDLQSLWTDKSLVREHLAWQLFGEMQNPYCSDRFVRVHANGKYYGLHAELEHPDANFLARNGLNPEGNLYKAVASREERMANYQAGYEKKTNENGDFSDLKTFLDTMNSVPRNQLLAFWEKNVVPDSLIDYQAGQVLTNNRDYPHKNHYLYHDTADGRWSCITWDMDLTFGKYWDGGNGGVLNDLMDTPGITPWYTTTVAGGGIENYLLDRFFSQTPDRPYARALRVRLWIALKEKYTPALFDKKLAALTELLMDEQDDDIKKWNRSGATANDPRAPREFLPNIERVRAHIKARHTYLTNYLKNTDRLPPPDQLKITEVMYHPLDRAQNLEYIELYNNTGKEIDVSGWTVQGIEYEFPAETKVAADEVIVIARLPEALIARYDEKFRVLGPYTGELSDDGEELRVRDVGPGYPATIDIVRYKADPPWPTQADDLGHSLELTGVTPDRDNDLPEHWRASPLAGGSPGRIPGIVRAVAFRRGNCNGDERVNITDAVLLLGLFVREMPAPRCPDACDANGDGALDISDVVSLLRYLFLAEDLIPAPGPRECGTAEGAFCEESSCPAPAG